MATNTTIPPVDEEKDKVQMPVYGNTTPIGTYYGEQGNEQADVMQRMINEWATRTDPQAQAEQDKKIQRGRAFWTGANLFANVIANAINAHGTAKGAPNMTINDAASQKMYDTWRDADKELKADRRAAQQRLEALQMQDAQMRAAGAEKRAGEVRNANDMNFRIALEQAQHERGRQEAEADWNRNQQAQIVAEERQAKQRAKEAATAHNYRISEQNNANRNAQELAVTRAQQAKGYNKGTKTIRIGNTDFKAETEAEADSNIAQVYGMVLAAYNKQFTNPMQQQAFDGKPENEYSFINAHINQLYASDPDFKAQYDAWANQHKRSVSSNQQSNSQQNNNSNNQGNGGESGLF
jgi:hypothetical protein